MTLEEAKNAGVLFRRPTGKCNKWGALTTKGKFMFVDYALPKDLTDEDKNATDWELQREPPTKE